MYRSKEEEVRFDVKYNQDGFVFIIDHSFMHVHVLQKIPYTYCIMHCTL